jgi:hypothetical protein
VLETSDTLERLLPGRKVREIVELVSSVRTRVERVHLIPVIDEVETVVVKRFIASEGYAAEGAALSCMPHGVPTPTLIAEDRGERLLVMSDVGDGFSVADALLGADRGVAEAALGSWAEALAAVHGATVGVRASFEAGIAERQAGTSIAVDPMPAWLGAVPEALKTSSINVGVALPDGIDGELHEIGRLLNCASRGALSPGDTCPDNNVFASGRLNLVDYEEASYRHIAWDLAYLKVPWPSCWCAWGIPESVAAKALARYVSAAQITALVPDGGAIEHEIDLALLGWGLISASWYLPSALKRDDTMGPPELVAPPRRATVLDRFRVSAAAAERHGYETLARTARAWERSLEGLWGQLRLPVAPALR